MPVLRAFFLGGAAVRLAGAQVQSVATTNKKVLHKRFHIPCALEDKKLNVT
jgi:hypothetical protein